MLYEVITIFKVWWVGNNYAIPATFEKVWDISEVKRKPADWALQWLWSQPEISVVLSGMSTMQQVEENLASAAGSSYNFV